MMTNPTPDPHDYANVVIHLEAELDYWSRYEIGTSALPVGGLPYAWPLCISIYSIRLNAPRIDDQQALAHFLVSSVMSGYSEQDRERLFWLIWSRINQLAEAHRSAREIARSPSSQAESKEILDRP